jgi:hypothetical protein
MKKRKKHLTMMALKMLEALNNERNLNFNKEYEISIANLNRDKTVHMPVNSGLNAVSRVIPGRRQP